MYALNIDNYLQIDDLEELEHLRGCVELQALNLENNALTQTPNYRLHVLAKLPKLKLLDNRDVTTTERKHAEAVVQKENSVMGLMLSNESLLFKLQLVRVNIQTESKRV